MTSKLKSIQPTWLVAGVAAYSYILIILTGHHLYFGHTAITLGIFLAIAWRQLHSQQSVSVDSIRLLTLIITATIAVIFTLISESVWAAMAGTALIWAVVWRPQPWLPDQKKVTIPRSVKQQARCLSRITAPSNKSSLLLVLSLPLFHGLQRFQNSRSSFSHHRDGINRHVISRLGIHHQL